MATMLEVARLAGVSAKTVSRVFNDDPHVLPETRSRVAAAMQELSYTPNVLARTFRAGRSSTVGVAVPDIVDPFFAAVVRAVEEQCALTGVKTLVTGIGDDPARERSVLESLLRTQPMGLVLAPVSGDHGWLAPWTEHTPVVFVDRRPAGIDADAFVEDDHDGAYLATRHLIGHGHRRIAFVADAAHPPSTARRLEGYGTALGESGIPLDPLLVRVDAAGREGAARVVTDLAALAGPPTAVFSSNARVTMDLVPALRGHPLALVGFGDFPMADQLTPPVSVIGQHPDRLGRLAATRVLARFDDPAAPLERPEVEPVHLVVRESCGCPPA
jgi:LacI family transcriptional regulator